MSGSAAFSVAFRTGMRLKNWKTKPMLRRRRRVSSPSDRVARSSSPMRTTPLVGRSSPPMRFSSVDLPQPLGPMIATNSPVSTENETLVERGDGGLAGRRTPWSGPRRSRWTWCLPGRCVALCTFHVCVCALPRRSGRALAPLYCCGLMTRPSVSFTVPDSATVSPALTPFLIWARVSVSVPTVTSVFLSLSPGPTT